LVDSRILSLAERVILRSDSAHPADSVLRLELQAERRRSELEAADVSHLVFSYFRWRGWLDHAKALSQQITHAADLAAKFKNNPADFSESELVARSVPAWLQKEIQGTPEFARAIQSEPKLWLRARPGQGSSLARRLGNCRVFGAGALSDALEYCGREDLFRTAEFHAGDFEVQDLSSQAVGLACAPEPGQTWWDACAGQGGKLLHLSDLMNNKGLIWATDRAQWRLRWLKRRAARAKAFNYRVAIWDGRAKLPTKTKFDGVLVDAPCSGTGTWQRNPHARWTLTPNDIAELAQLQTELLTHSAAAVKPGGKLVYSVCSLTRAESVNLVEAFESRLPDFTPLQMVDPLIPKASPAARLFLSPQQFGGNGMFISAWVRTAS
jgi:16S rRNA (cytosine967-C5)-methyltransferase